jgi:hypothetical protein
MNSLTSAGRHGLASPVAQIFNLLYRRFLIGRGPSEGVLLKTRDFVRLCARQVESLRYSRLKICATLCCLLRLTTQGGESWQSALAEMPIGANVRQLNRTNCVELMLHALQSNQVVKALVFMPGATDEFYMFRRAQAGLTNDFPSLFDAVTALTNQTLIHATFHAPLLLLHTDEDVLETVITIEHPLTAERLKQSRFVPHAFFNDRDWDFLQPALKWPLKLDLRPWRYSRDSWHFYRHSFAGWNLSGWEALEAVALAGKSGFIVRKNQIVFEPDRRFGTLGKP